MTAATALPLSEQIEMCWRQHDVRQDATSIDLRSSSRVIKFRTTKASKPRPPRLSVEERDMLRRALNRHDVDTHGRICYASRMKLRKQILDIVDTGRHLTRSERGLVMELKNMRPRP